MNISIAWWNTSLSPRGSKAPPTHERINIAAKVIEFFTSDLYVDVVCLAEVSASDIAAIKLTCASDAFEFIELFDVSGRSSFDLCLIYRRSKLSILRKRAVTVRRGNSVLRLACIMEFKVEDFEKSLHLIVSHWPSRLWTGVDHSDRHVLGMRLRELVDEILDADLKALVILAGDYNDEPFDRSLSEHLMASRDRSLVEIRPRLLYNPFWRHMSHATAGTVSSSSSRLTGTYYHKNGQSTRWRTFDQIIFSSAFVSGNDWEIDESRTLAIDIPYYSGLVTDSTQLFDHLPVLGIVRKI